MVLKLVIVQYHAASLLLTGQKFLISTPWHLIFFFSIFLVNPRFYQLKNSSMPGALVSLHTWTYRHYLQHPAKYFLFFHKYHFKIFWLFSFLLSRNRNRNDFTRIFPDRKTADPSRRAGGDTRGAGGGGSWEEARARSTQRRRKTTQERHQGNGKRNTKPGR